MLRARRRPRHPHDARAGQAAARGPQRGAVRAPTSCCWFAEEAKRVYGATIPSSAADQRFLVLRQPVGVVAAITPWNYPVSMITRKVGAGARRRVHVVLKPAEQTPLCAVAVVQDLRRRRPARRASSTWSPPTTRSIGRRRVLDQPGRPQADASPGPPRSARSWAARPRTAIKRVSLELGGHAPFIVFGDADPAHAAKGAAAWSSSSTPARPASAPTGSTSSADSSTTFVDTLAERVAQDAAPATGFDDGVTDRPADRRGRH